MCQKMKEKEIRKSGITLVVITQSPLGIVGKVCTQIVNVVCCV